MMGLSRSRETTHTVVLGDARSLERLGDGSVHLVVTSPPYWQLKDYGARGQIGFDQTYEEYIADLGRVWEECARVLHPGCRMAVNIGDQFARSASYGRYRVIPIRSEIIRKCEALGLDPMGAVIWQKCTTCNTTGGGTVMGSFPYPRNGILKIDYEFILIFRKPGEPPKVPPDLKEEARLTTAEWNEYFHGHWRFPGARQEEHIAVFPLELPRRLIRMFTFPGEVVLDPFLGSGTTLRAARDLGRSSVGYEIHEEFLETIRRKAGFGEEREIFGSDDVFHVIREETLPPAAAPGDLAGGGGAAAAARRPLGGFGSVLRKGDPREREELHRVREVKDIRTIVLDGGVEHRLAGVLPNGRSQGEGVDFLRRLLGRRRVYLRTEEAFEFERGVYLHLENRTCVNARLIRLGLADADPAAGYRLRKRFLRYQLAREAPPVT